MPPYTHISELLSFSAGSFPTKTVGSPGIQGAGSTGTQGPGVPVAMIKVGHKGDEHKQNGATFTYGLLSIMVAIGLLSVNTSLIGSTVSIEGAIPIVQVIIAPLETKFPIFFN